ncbi:MAG: hypothetical protein JWQ01_4809 [Massilia sp.]|nr:hypothetical protein [Massilia sp.]
MLNKAEIELLPCPFCGASATLKQENGTAHAICLECKSTPWIFVEMWNRRTPPAPAPSTLAGEEIGLPTNDEVYAEVCRDRGKSNFYVSTNAVNDVMQAVRALAVPRQAAVAGRGQPPDWWRARIDAEIEVLRLKRADGEA